MTIKRYAITAWESGAVVDYLEGPPVSMPDLWNQFAEQFGYPPENTDYSYNGISLHIERIMAADERAQEAGYSDSDHMLFIDWLIKEHGFRKVEAEHFHIPVS